MNQQQPPSRRKFIKQSGLLTLAGIGISALGTPLFGSEKTNAADEDFFKLPPLPYPYDALEPHIDKLTMQIHHDKHHAAYVAKLNEAFKGAQGLTSEPPLDMLFQSLSSISEENADPKHPSPYQVAIRNNGGGHYNHSMFWKLMKPNGGGSPTGKIADAINGSFDSFDNFKTKLNAAAASRFGSGWAWLVITEAGKLEIGSTPNQDNPLMDLADFKGTPILGLDVWEHAYYLKHQNKRADYIKDWWNVVNWEKAQQLFEQK